MTLLQEASASGDSETLAAKLAGAKAPDVTRPMKPQVDPLCRTALHAAVLSGSTECVRMLLDAGAEIQQQDASGATALHLAVRQRDEAAVSLLMVKALTATAVRAETVEIQGSAKKRSEQEKRQLEALRRSRKRRKDPGAAEGVAPRGGASAAKAPPPLSTDKFYAVQDEMGDTPVLLAAEFNMCGPLEQFLAAGAGGDDLRHSVSDDSALHLAAERGNAKCLKALLARGLDASAVSGSDQTPLHRAAQGCAGGAEAAAEGAFGDCIRLLLVADAETALARDTAGNTAFDELCRADPMTFGLLEGVGGAAAAADGGVSSDASPACTPAYSDAMEAFITHCPGASLAAAEHAQGGTALHSAVRHKNVQATIAVLGSGSVPVDAMSSVGETALHLAAERDAGDIVLHLAKAGASLNATRLRQKRGTALHTAAKSDRVEAAKALLAVRADVGSVDRDGNTPLHYAAQGGSRRVMRVLLTEGAPDLAAENSGGHTALFYATKLGSKVCIDMLKAPDKLTPLGRPMQPLA